MSNSNDVFFRKDYTEEDIRYLKTVINSKIIKNDYPFIIKFNLSDDFDKQIALIPIIMVMDFEKYSEFVGLPLEKYWYEKSKNEKVNFGGMTGPIDVNGDYMKNIENIVKLKSQIEKEVNDLYRIITPKENRIKFAEIVNPDYEFESQIYITGVSN